MLITRWKASGGSKAARKVGVNTCMYLASTTSSMPCSASSSRWRASAASRLLASMGTYSKWAPNSSASGPRLGWLLITSGTRIGSSPVRVRQSRSSRPWSCLLTKIATGGRSSEKVTWNWPLSRSARAWAVGPIASRGRPKPASCHSIRLRNRPAPWSLWWSAWTMLPPLAATQPDSSRTRPGRSGQIICRMAVTPGLPALDTSPAFVGIGGIVPTGVALGLVLVSPFLRSVAVHHQAADVGDNPG